MTLYNLHLYPAEFIQEIRMLKETKSLAESGLIDEVIVGAMWQPGLEEHQEIDRRRWVRRVPVKSGVLPIRILARLSCIGEWGVKLLREFGRRPMDIVQCHSLSCLPIGVLFKLLYGSKLVYDCHELETETASSKGVRRVVTRLAERILIPFADKVLVVGEFIRGWYEDRYHRGDIVVVRNVPYRWQGRSDRGDKLRKAFGLSPDDTLFIYQGVFAKERKTDLFLRTFARCPGDKHIVFMGRGLLEGMVSAYAAKHPNIHFQPAVPPEQVIEYTCSADVGLSMLTDDCLNHRYCLPNKFFEYLMAGVPVLASDFPEMGAFIDQHGCGWRAPHDEDGLVEFIASLSPAEVASKRAKVLASQGSYCWEDEAPKLIAAYRDLVPAAKG